jgi:hypothetical protein
MLASVFFFAREPKEEEKCMQNNVPLVLNVLIL